MDRDKRWDRIEKAYNAMVMGEGERSGSALQAAEESYKNDIADEFILPTIITDDKGQPMAAIRDNDSVIFLISAQIGQERLHPPLFQRILQASSAG